MPDKSNELKTLSEDTANKTKIKGEIISFMITTAREFATRQQKQIRVIPNRLTGVITSGMTRPSMNKVSFNKVVFWRFLLHMHVLFNICHKMWTRMPYDNCGEPVFRSSCNSFYLYYRSIADSWVIDDLVELTGSVYSSTDSKDIMSKVCLIFTYCLRLCDCVI